VDTEPAWQAKPNLVLVVDDDVFFRESIVAFLRRRGFTTLEAGDFETAYNLAAEARPTAAIIDLVLPPGPNQPVHVDQNLGVELARRLKQLDPTIAVVLFSAFGNRSRAVLTLAVEGFSGLAYITKGYNSGPATLLQALKETRAGHVLILVDQEDEAGQLASRFWQRLTPEERQLVSRAVALFPTLTDRESEIARALGHGLTVQAVAEKLGISIRTAEKHINHIYSKLELDRADAFDPPLRKSVLLAKTVWLLDMLAGEDDGD